VALRLRELGFDESYALAGGFDAWRAAGYPIERKEAGEQPPVGGP
jgi:rhodanese-related sulfurtransferase